jgi:hypothetical protein
VEGHGDRTESTASDAHSGPARSEDELAREMIARIAREVDLEVGRRPLEYLEHDAEPEGGEQEAEQAEAPVAEATDEAGEPSEEDVTRDLVERIAREVDEELRG